MKKISAKELQTILELHQDWLNNIEAGRRADLQGADLQDADLQGVYLQDADLRGANLRGVYLQDADLRGACLRDANLRGANLWGANLEDADLRGACLRDANLRGANLRGANLGGANLEGVETNNCTLFFEIACPEDGEFIAYKKASETIIKMLIPADAKRCSATSYKCRANRAMVLEISDGSKSVRSDHDKDFIYTVGETVEVADFDEDRWNECAPGIHFFINKKHAETY